MATTLYTLLILSEQSCRECFSSGTHLLLERENELIGIYCYTHGKRLHESLEQKYQFERENIRGKEVQKLRKKVRSQKKRQDILRLAVQISALGSNAKENLAVLLQRLEVESISSELLNSLSKKRKKIEP